MPGAEWRRSPPGDDVRAGKPDGSRWHPMAVRRTLRGAAGVVWLLTLAVSALAADNLTLAPGLSFTDDSSDNFPVRGDHLADAEVVEGRAAVVFFGASNCWNTAREAERLVTLYPKIRDRVSFIGGAVNHPSEAQRPLPTD